MKSLKAAAVVAGSLVAAGAAAPAFAGTSGPLDLKPLKVESENLLNTESKDSALHTVKDTTNTLNNHKQMLGGLPLQR
ncbi:hypothetical protein [Streptomyces sp. JNUCC 63]